ncbi:endolysin [Snodgrassella alvi]|uniref:M15 family metallopeptidase n=1 Tax=Snodgrassella alvi TaxID=1196083 RepID=UPI0009FCD0C7|nr:M15 family metallopeptidase [Snodgrassella alvi]ORF03573.1 endolysin [Snodgrassella alvi]ORF09736.1 endolysin [Snodgrassella alvi]ORF14734.1 endolysin [Snodgrassella alvi]ORF16309.1 endolysin [Snodgrassella alvi]ORF22356.1 endolysin [Snodgrassella alvi]
MTYILGSNSRKKLEGVHPKLVQVVQLAIQKTTQDFSVYEGLRTKNRQVKLVQRGASQTMNSKHLPQNDGYGHAVDLLPWADFDGNGTKEVAWHWPAIYPIAEAMRNAAKELNIRIRWGGNWSVCLNETDKTAEALVRDYVTARQKAGKKAFIDGPHFELL